MAAGAKGEVGRTTTSKPLQQQQRRRRSSGLQPRLEPLVVPKVSLSSSAGNGALSNSSGTSKTSPTVSSSMVASMVFGLRASAFLPFFAFRGLPHNLSALLQEYQNLPSLNTSRGSLGFSSGHGNSNGNAHAHSSSGTSIMSSPLPPLVHTPHSNGGQVSSSSFYEDDEEDDEEGDGCIHLLGSRNM